MSAEVPRRNRSSGTKRKRAAFKVMEGQTEEERRALRKDQRSVLDRIQDRQQEMVQLDSTAYAEERALNNQLFEHVRYNRELGNDGDNLVAIGSIAIQRSAQLAHSVSQYSAQGIMEKLRERYGRKKGGGLWLNLGNEVCGLFKAVPRMDFMSGPLEQPQTKKATRQKRTKQVEDDNDIEETQYETMDYATQTSSRRRGAPSENTAENLEQCKQEEATNKRLQHLLSTLEKKHGEEGKESIDMMSLLVSPDSFHQTVENFFDFSFLVKDGKGQISIDKNTGLPVCGLTEPPEEQVKKFQTVVVLGPEDHKRISQLWKIQQAALTRDG